MAASPDIARKLEVPSTPAAVMAPPVASAPAFAQAPASAAPPATQTISFPVTLKDAPFPLLDAEPELEGTAPLMEEAAPAAPAKAPAASAPIAQPSPKVESAPIAPPPAQEPKKAEPVAEAPVAVPPAPSTPAPAREPLAASPVAPAPVADPAPAAPDRRPRTVAVQPVELPSDPVGDIQVSSHLELMDWRQTETAEASSGAESSPPWTRRAIEVDFSSEEASPTEAGASDADGEIPLASVHEFIPTWDPSAEPPPAEPEAGVQPEEGFSGWDEGMGASAATPAGDAERIKLVQFQESLDALRQATTQGELGKVLLDYCQGRFPRGFLLGETFGYARVGRAYGPGSDKYEVSALQVDLEAPSLLAMAAAGGRAVVSSVPESPMDEQLFAALGESFSHLMAAPIRLHQRAVGFVVLDSGPSPFGAEELDELEQLLSAASEAYGRLHDVSS
ncbi:hypothetical protein BO221_30290 [Archangium sp. Cb G35]|nr:hypothetical protein BO221_30290 [Archangium sp. Cb G35]